MNFSFPQHYHVPRLLAYLTARLFIALCMPTISSIRSISSWNWLPTWFAFGSWESHLLSKFLLPIFETSNMNSSLLKLSWLLPVSYHFTTKIAISYRVTFLVVKLPIFGPDLFELILWKGGFAAGAGHALRMINKFFNLIIFLTHKNIVPAAFTFHLSVLETFLM